jgi:RNA polymerase sigma-70 factor (ECF subfamily)
MAKKKRPAPIERLPDRADASPGTVQRAVAREEAQMLAEAIAELPARQRLALSLVYEEDMKTADAAQAMNLRLKAFESLLHRARQALRERLQERQKGAQA